MALKSTVSWLSKGVSSVRQDCTMLDQASNDTSRCVDRKQLKAEAGVLSPLRPCRQRQSPLWPHAPEPECRSGRPRACSRS